MASLEHNDRQVLLKLARSAILAELLKDRNSIIKPKDISPLLKEKRGCFVTLHKCGSLRGCIGTIDPTTALISSVEENAINAAFRDPRFSPLEREEINAIDIEISVLTVPREIKFRDSEDLKKQIIPGVHGVILSQGYRRSTFLPQVWEQLPKKEDFLEHLCLKGGMSRSAWQDTHTRVEVYEAEYFSEKQLPS
ncbi:MAG: AmmeMemoRadiSam system protein A [Desulfobacterales bacterium]|nr:AmmeMemoRadiSam system protein A [Desulfobacterales bacterium]